MYVLGVRLYATSSLSWQRRFFYVLWATGLCDQITTHRSHQITEQVAATLYLKDVYDP